jgi:hypothetical protein
MDLRISCQDQSAFGECSETDPRSGKRGADAGPEAADVAVFRASRRTRKAGLLLLKKNFRCRATHVRAHSISSMTPAVIGPPWPG